VDASVKGLAKLPGDRVVDDDVLVDAASLVAGEAGVEVARPTTTVLDLARAGACPCR